MRKHNHPRQAARRRPRSSHVTTLNSLYRRPLRYEPLEDRRLLALVTVNTLSDVTNLNDNLTTLREAIFATNLVGGADTIDFAPALTANGPATILLTQGELKITDSLTLTGPGANLLTIDASGSDPTPDQNNGDGSRVFAVSSPTISSLIDVTLRSLRIAGGDVSSSGGGISNSYGNLTLDHVAVVGNSSRGGGGVHSSSGNLTIWNTSIRENRSSRDGGGIFIGGGNLAIDRSTISQNVGDGSTYGGGVYFAGAVSKRLEITHTTISQNIVGASGGGLVVQLNGATVLITDCEISGNTSTNSSLAQGGGIRVSGQGGSFTLQDSIVSNNSVGSQGQGGGLFVNTFGSTVVIDNSTITSNFGGQDGGGIYNRGSLQINQSTIHANSTQGASGGGGITSNGNLQISSSTISGNLGSGIRQLGGVLTVGDSTISGNSTSGSGGGLYASKYIGPITITHSDFLHNTAALDGGGIYHHGRGPTPGAINNPLNIANSTIDENSSGRNGGGLYSWVFFDTPITISGSTIRGNTAAQDGGGVYASASTNSLLEFSNNDVSENTSQLRGGGMYLIAADNSNAFVTQTTVHHNSAANGGGLYVELAIATATLDQVTVSGNSSMNRGAGGLVVSSSSTSNLAFVRRSTITDNSLTYLGPLASTGGAFVGGQDLTLSLDHSIIAGNHVTTVGGADLLLVPDVHLDTNHMLLGDGTGSGLEETAPGFPDAHGNLIGGPVHGVIDPLLGPLADNGGFTLPDGSHILTHALLAGSPAINAGDLNLQAGVDGVPQFDQRGTPFSRVVNGRIDIGAFEYQAASELNLLVDTLVDESDGNYSRGDLSLREAIELANLWPSIDTIHFDPALTASGPATILLTQGELQITDSVTITGPGADSLTIDASGNDATPSLKDGNGTRVFNIDHGPVAAVTCSISGLTLTGGDVKGSGGAIRNDQKLTLVDLYVRGNAATDGGGGLYASVSTSDASVTINSCVFLSNSSTYGGGGGASIGAASGASVWIANSSFRTNTSSGTTADGGGLRITAGTGDGQIVLDNNEFDGNSTAGTGATGGGAYIFLRSVGNLTVNHNRFSGNTTKGTLAQGGGVYLVHSGSGAMKVIANSFFGNSTSGTSVQGGGAYVNHVGRGDLILTDNEFLGNSTSGTGANGGGLALYKANSGIANVVRNVATRNSARGTSAGGIGIFASAGNGASVFVRNNTATDNTPNELGDRPPGYFGISTSTTVGGTAFIENNKLFGNQGGIGAGGEGLSEVNDNSVIGNDGTGISLSARGGGVIHSARNVITGNSSSIYAGGGLALGAQLGGTVTVVDTSVSENTSERIGAGANVFLSSGGLIEIINTTISHNHVIATENPDSGYGGGVCVRNEGGTLTMDQTTISSNSADLEGGGLWIDNRSESGVSIRRSTITNNTSDADENGLGSGGGIFVFRGIVDLDHTIVAGNQDNSGTARDIAGIFNAHRSLIGIGANYLGPLADNGGPTLTHALLAGSPAINAGNPAAMIGVNGVPEHDQRGAPFIRVYGGRIDMGAIESQPAALLGDYNSNGIVDAADYVLWRTSTPSVPNLSADGNGDGQVNDADRLVWQANFGEPAAATSMTAASTTATSANASIPAIAVEANTNHAVQPTSPARRPTWSATRVSDYRPNVALPALTAVINTNNVQPRLGLKRNDEASTSARDLHVPPQREALTVVDEAFAAFRVRPLAIRRG